MSNDDTDERDDPNPGDPGAGDRPPGFRLEAGLRPLSSLLGGLIEVNASEAPPPPDDPVDWRTVDERYPDRPRSGDEAGRERTIRVPKTAPDESLVDTRYDDEFVVTADVPGASTDDLSVGIDPGTNELAIGRDGTVLERVSLPWESPEPTTVWFNNGVLEVRIRPAES